MGNGTGQSCGIKSRVPFFFAGEEQTKGRRNMPTKTEIFQTRHGAAKVAFHTSPPAVVIAFGDGSNITINDHAAAVRLNTAPDRLPFTPYPSSAAKLVEDMRDYIALEMDFPEEVQELKNRIWEFFGVKETADNARKTSPIDWTQEGFKKRIARRGERDNKSR